MKKAREIWLWRLRRHPTPELLTAYQEDRLPLEEEAAIQEHFVECPECPELMLDLDRFTSPEKAKAAEADLSDTWVDAAWRRLRARLAAEPRPARLPAEPRPAGLPVEPRPSRQPQRWLTSPVPAWGLTVLLLPCTVGLWLQVDAQGSEIRALVLPQLNPPQRSVEPPILTRGGPTLASDGGVPEVEVPAGARQFLLVLASSSTASHPEYRLEIRNELGEEIWSGGGFSRSDDGSFVVVLSPRFLPAGDYRLRVIGIGGEAGALPFDEEFHVRLTYR